MLAPSKFLVASSGRQREEDGGSSKCGGRCDLCKNCLIQASGFQSSATRRRYPIQRRLSCSSRSVIYLATCAKCNLQYVAGSTSTEFKVRFRNHKRKCWRTKQLVNWKFISMTLNKKFLKSTVLLLNKLGLLKMPHTLNDCYSLGRPIGPRSYLPLIFMVSTNGGNLDPNTAFITTIEQLSFFPI